MSEKSGFKGESVGGVGIFAIERSDADSARRKNGRIDKVRKVGNAFYSAHCMDNGDERVSLTAAVLGAEPDDRRDLAAFAGQTQADGFEQFLHAARWVALGKEGGGVEVVDRRGAIDDTRKICHEFVIADSP